MEHPAPENPADESLLAENARLRLQVADLSTQLAEALARLETALAEIDRLKRQGKRQATPFSTGKRVEKPKKPGRKRGEGLFRRRAAPDPSTYTREEHAYVTERDCECGGSLKPTGMETATVTDVPVIVPLEVLAVHLEWCQCGDCGRRVRAIHPEIPADQRGATAHRLGPRLLARAHWLHYRVGVTMRKVPQVLAMIYGLTVTQSALTQDALRRARGKVGAAYQELRTQIAQEPVVGTDDTGWKVGGAGAFLMGFFTRITSVFQIRRRHRNEEVREVIPGDYAGTLGTDRGRSYEARELAGVKQQKCLAHIQRSLSDALEGQRGRRRSFCLRLKKLLREAVALWEAYHTGTASDYAAERDRLVAAMDEHLKERPIRGEANRRLLSELGWHHRQGNLLRFLNDPAVEPTNNRSERGLRPAVIARKVSHCSKNWDGAEAHAAFASVFATLTLREHDVVAAMTEVFRTGKMPSRT